MFEGNYGIPCSVPVAPLATGTSGNGGNGMFGGDGWWAIIIFALIFGWGRGGYGGFSGGNGGGADSGALTRGELCQDMNFQSLENAVRGVQSGLCDGFYAMNTGMLNGFSGIQNTLCSGFAELAALGNSNANAVQQSINAMNISNLQTANAQNIAALQNQNALQTQIADCCCENREGQAQIRYDMATNACGIQNTIQNTTRDIIDNQNANSRAILDYLCQDKIATLQSENQALRLSASQQAQNNYLISQLKPQPVPAYPAASPCGLGNWSPAVLANGYGYNSGCGCGCGCSNAYGVA